MSNYRRADTPNASYFFTGNNSGNNRGQTTVNLIIFGQSKTVVCPLLFDEWVKDGKVAKGELQQRIVGHVEAGSGARAKALELEKANANRLRSEGQLSREFHQRP